MKKSEQENPYLNARRAHNEYEGGLIASRHMWQIFGVLGLLIGLAGVGGTTYIADKTMFIPYVVEVDQLGQTYVVSRADQATTADPRVIHATVARFITLSRMVTPDVAVQRKAIFDLYAFLSGSDPATAKMADYLGSKSDTSPFKRAAKETVDIQITSALPQSDQTWQVDWTETVRDRGDGAVVSRFRMRALLTIYITPPSSRTSEDQLRKNPLGIFIRDFNWSKQL